MTSNLNPAMTKIEAAVQSGQLSKAAEENLRTWLTQPQYEAYGPRLLELIDGGSWSVLQD